MGDTFSYSTDEETFHDSLPTREEAFAEASDRVEPGDECWTGRAVPPTPPELLWDADRWLEHVSVQDDYSSEFAEDWDRSTKEQRAELEELVRPILAAWLDRHGLRPKHYTVVDVQKHVAAGEVEAQPTE